jgi:hypothetical protein
MLKMKPRTFARCNSAASWVTGRAMALLYFVQMARLVTSVVLPCVVGDPVTALAPLRLRSSIGFQHVAVVGFASGRLVAVPIPPLPPSPAMPTATDPGSGPPRDPTLPSGTVVEVRPQLKSHDGKVSADADVEASEARGAVASPVRNGALSPDWDSHPDSFGGPTAFNPLVSEILLREHSEEAVKDILVSHDAVYVAIGDVSVLVFGILPSFQPNSRDSLPKSAVPSPFLPAIDLRFAQEHSYHRCPKSVTFLFPFAVPGPPLPLHPPVSDEKSSEVADNAENSGPCAAIFTENSSQFMFMDLKRCTLRVGRLMARRCRCSVVLIASVVMQPLALV